MPKTPSRNSPSKDVDSEARSRSSRNYVAIANKYARDVVRGKIPACVQVRQACQRHLNDLDRQADPAFEFMLDPESATRVCRFLEALPHVKGKWASQRATLTLEPWQCFIAVSLFGWVEKLNPHRYRFREAYVCVPRKNGKSFLSAGIGLYKFAADDEYCAEVYFGATSEKQAKRVGFKPARAMAHKCRELCKAFGIKVNTHSLVKESDGSVLAPVIAQPGDGDSPSCSVVDEYHEHAKPVLYDTMKTGMGARENPLMFVITTAGSNRGGPCYLLQQEMEDILSGKITNERVFAIIYTIDSDDDWKSEKSLIKANPNYGVSIEPEFLRNEQRAAIASAAKQNTFKTKYLNIWCNAAVAWMNMAKWDVLADPSLKEEDFAGEPCVEALDLASELDIASRGKLFSRKIAGKDHYYFFCNHYLNEQAIEDGGDHYNAWVEDGWLTKTDGNITDYPRIGRDLVDDTKRFRILEVPHDPYHAAAMVQFIQQMEDWNQAIEFTKVVQSVEVISPAMKQLEALVIDGRLHHDGDPVLAWMISNVIAVQKPRSNIFPDKESPDRKIDGAMVLMFCLSRMAIMGVDESAIDIDSI